MGRTRNHRNRATKNKQYKKSSDTKRRRRDLDQIQDDLKKEDTDGKKMAFEIDEDTPGLGQHYCTYCGRHFMSQGTLETHEKTKDHRRRMKEVLQEQYSQQEADLGAGKSIEILPPAHAPKATEAMSS